MRIINKLPLMAFVLGFGFIGINSGFKSQTKPTLNLLFGYDATNPSSPWTPVPTEGYNCVRSSNICTYSFPENAPPVNDGIESTPRDEGTEVEGSFGDYKFTGE